MSVYIVYGAPSSGKTTYVLERIKYGDVIIDFDLIYSALSGQPIHNKPENLFFLMVDIRKRILNEVFNHQKEIKNIWIITSGIKKIERENLARRFNGELIFIKATKQECYERLEKDQTRNDVLTINKNAIEQWFEKFEA